MAALQCEICGGRLIGRPGGIFECDSCGMEYDTAWAKQKIQEIKGTVQVEGTVEITGTVKLDGPVEIKGGATVENLLKRGQISIEGGQWATAQKCFDDVLCIEPECAKAYLGLAMCEKQKRTLQDLIWNVKIGDIRIDGKRRPVGSHNYERAKQFADKVLLESILEAEKEAESQKLEDDYQRTIKAIENSNDSKELLELADELAKMEGYKEASEKRQLCLQKIATLQIKARANTKEKKQYWSMIHNRFLCVNTSYPAILLPAGKVKTLTGNIVSGIELVDHPLCSSPKWNDLVAIAGYHRNYIGLKSDGTVVATGENKKGQSEVLAWRNIKAIAAVGDHYFGLTETGTMKVTNTKEGDTYGFSDVTSWTNISSFCAVNDLVIGVKTNGTVVATKWLEFDSNLNRYKRCSITGWRNIRSVAIGSYPVRRSNYIVGLKADGTVVVTGNDSINDEVQTWKNIVAIVAGCDKVFGLTSDGTVVSAGDYRGVQWENTIAIAASYGDELWALLEDGSIKTTDVSYSNNNCTLFDDVCEVWNLAKKIKTGWQEREVAREIARKAEVERKAEQERREREQKCAALQSEKQSLQNELANLRGLFSGKRRREIEERLKEIDHYFGV